MSQPAQYPVLHDPGGDGPDPQPHGRSAGRRIPAGAAVLLGAAGVLVALLVTGQGGDGDDELSRAADHLADALSTGSAAALAELSCQAPTQAQSSAFDSALTRSPASFSVTEPAQVQEDDASAVVMMHMVPDGDELAPHDLPYLLRNDGDGWCVMISWNQFEEHD